MPAVTGDWLQGIEILQVLNSISLEDALKKCSMAQEKMINTNYRTHVWYSRRQKSAQQSN